MNLLRWLTCLWGNHEPGEVVIGRYPLDGGGMREGRRCRHCDRPLWFVR